MEDFASTSGQENKLDRCISKIYEELDMIVDNIGDLELVQFSEIEALCGLLFEKGIISQEEFNKRKVRILAKADQAVTEYINEIEKEGKNV